MALPYVCFDTALVNPCGIRLSHWQGNCFQLSAHACCFHQEPASPGDYDEKESHHAANRSEVFDRNRHQCVMHKVTFRDDLIFGYGVKPYILDKSSKRLSYRAKRKNWFAAGAGLTSVSVPSIVPQLTQLIKSAEDRRS